jgi:hypothetical protein
MDVGRTAHRPRRRRQVEPSREVLHRLRSCRCRAYTPSLRYEQTAAEPRAEAYRQSASLSGPMLIRWAGPIRDAEAHSRVC